MANLRPLHSKFSDIISSLIKLYKVPSGEKWLMHSHRFIKIIWALSLLFMFFSTSAFSLDIFNWLSKSNHTHNASVTKTQASYYKQQVQTRVKVGVYVLQIGKYDLQNANYHMDFYLILNCKPKCHNLTFEIMNASQAYMRLEAKQEDYLVYRVSADLSKSSNLRNYPFDKHNLSIVIEDKQYPVDKLVFESDPSTTALDDNVHIVGYQLLPHWSAEVTKHYYKVFQQTYSSYKFNVTIKRPWLAGFLKGVLPALIIICCNFLALFLRGDMTAQRLSVATGTLIASVVFHLNLTSSLPPLGYITFADMFMLINYIFLLLVLIEVVMTAHFIQTHHKERAEFFNVICARLFPAVWLLLQLINWFAFNPAKNIYS